MNDLFIRTLCQGLQAFLPIACLIAWLRRDGRAVSIAGIRLGLVAAVPATAIAAYLFRSSNQQAQWETLLAVAALVLAVWFAVALRREPRIDSPRQPLGRPIVAAFAAGTVLIVTRQTMEIGVVLGAAVFELRSLDAAQAIGGGAALAAALALFFAWGARRLPASAFMGAARTFAVIFLGQAALYAFHEAAEARLLPWSDILHAATEPYGPDGLYGRYVSYALVALPAAAAVLSVVNGMIRARVAPAWQRRLVLASRGALAAGMLAAAALLFVGLERRAGTEPAPAAVTAAPAPEAMTIAAAPHLMFRETGIDRNYSRLSVAPIDAAVGAGRAASGLTCERVSYAAGEGICLQADRGVLTTYRAVLFDRMFAPGRRITLEGSPSRTRISADGRVGAVTVFIGQAHGYSNSSFSTKTTLIDMASGEVLTDLEQFTTWRNGARFSAPDFNFWGVTFAKDSNVFYASLRTNGSTFLVRGDLGLRKFTVLHENVECPSLSPDNRLIAYKKRVGPHPAAWRLYTLDLATMAERPIAGETRFIDDQAEWLDNGHVLYAVPRPGSATIDTWVAAVDGNQPARVYLPQAESPIVVR
jgi:hypothetical protein